MSDLLLQELRHYRAEARRVLAEIAKRERVERLNRAFNDAASGGREVREHPGQPSTLCRVPRAYRVFLKGNRLTLVGKIGRMAS